MKKTISMIFLFMTIISVFSSCGGDSNINFVNDRCIYRTDSFTLYCYDLVNKTCMIACPDPLCEHGNDCPVTNLDETTITDRYIFLRKGFDGRSVTMSVYDLATNKINEIASGVQSNAVSMAGEYAFFTMSHYEYSEDGELEKEVFNLYRYDTRTGEVKAFTETPVNGSVTVLHYDNERIVWYGLRDGYFSSDYDFNDITEADRTSAVAAINTVDGCLYENSSVTDEYGRKNIMKKTNLETGEIYTFFDEADSFRWANKETKSGILYRPSEIVLVEIDGEEKYVRRGINTIVYVNTKDPSKIFEFKLPENIVTATVSSEFGNRWYLNDYTSTSVSVYSYDEEGNKYSTTAMFVINCETGESFVIENEDTTSLVQKASETTEE